MTALFNLHVGDYLAFRIKILARTNYFLLNVVLFRMKLKDSKLTCQKSCIEESVLHLLLELECQTYIVRIRMPDIYDIRMPDIYDIRE